MEVQCHIGYDDQQLRAVMSSMLAHLSSRTSSLPIDIPDGLEANSAKHRNPKGHATNPKTRVSGETHALTADPRGGISKTPDHLSEKNGGLPVSAHFTVGIILSSIFYG